MARAADSSKKREVLLLSAILCVMAAAVIWVRTATVEATYRFVSEEKRFHKIQGEAQDARIRWLKMTAPRRLESLAHSLGLQAPQLQQILKLSADKGKLDRAAQ